MMDRLKSRVASTTEASLGEPLDVLFFDCATLYFESAADDEHADALRAVGYSKDEMRSASKWCWRWRSHLKQHPAELDNLLPNAQIIC